MSDPSGEISLYRKPEANYSTEILFTEFYRSIVRVIGNIVRAQHSDSERRLQIQYFWVLINLAWAPIRVAIDIPEKELKALDAKFKEKPNNAEEAIEKVYLLIEQAAKAGVLIKFDYAVSNYDDIFSRPSGLTVE